MDVTNVNKAALYCLAVIGVVVFVGCGSPGCNHIDSDNGDDQRGKAGGVWDHQFKLIENGGS